MFKKEKKNDVDRKQCVCVYLMLFLYFYRPAYVYRTNGYERDQQPRRR